VPSELGPGRSGGWTREVSSGELDSENFEKSLDLRLSDRSDHALQAPLPAGTRRCDLVEKFSLAADQLSNSDPFRKFRSINYGFELHRCDR
jgi:hypothetical protein